MLTGEDFFRLMLINAVVALYPAWQWSVGFAVFKGLLHQYAYWNSWGRLALMVTIFVLGQYLAPIGLLTATITGRALGAWALDWAAWIASFTLCKSISLVLNYTLWPACSALWIVLHSTIPVFLQLVFIPCCLPQIVQEFAERVMCFRLSMNVKTAREYRRRMETLEEQAEKHKKEIEHLAKHHHDGLSAKDNVSAALRAQLKEATETIFNQSTEIKRLAHECTHHQATLEKRMADLRYELSTKSNECKATLHAQLDELNQELAQRRLDRTLYERKTREMQAAYEQRNREVESRLNGFAKVLESVEALYHRLVTRLRPTEVEPAILGLEESIKKHEAEVGRLANKTRSLEDQLAKSERQHKAAIERMQTELKEKDDRLLKLNTPKPANPHTHLNRCDKQLLLKLAKSPDFAWHFHTFMKSADFEPFIKGYMKLEVQHQHLFSWMMTVITSAKIDEYVYHTFGRDHALLSIITTGIIQPDLLSTPRRVELSKANTNSVLRTLHTDKLVEAPKWLQTLREHMFKAFREARDVLG